MSKCRPLPINSFVLLTNFNLHREASNKLQPLKVGPYKVVALVDQETYRIRDVNNVQRDIHRTHLIPYYPRNIALPPLIIGYLTNVKK